MPALAILPDYCITEIGSAVTQYFSNAALLSLSQKNRCMKLTPSAYRAIFSLSTSGRAFFPFMASERYTRIWDAEKKTAVRIHRVVAQEHLGRALAPGEVVHHVNGDRSDNRPENLRVLPSQGHHMALEQLQRKVSGAPNRCSASTSC